MLKTLIKITQKKQLFPFYHMVENETPVFIKHLYTPKTVNEFKRDLDFFLHYYESVSLAQTIQTKIQHRKLKNPIFHISFDDGLSNFYHVIAPILLKKNIHATVFLNSAFIDNKELFYRYKASILIEEYLTSRKEKQKKMEDFVKSKTNSKLDVPDFLLQINYQNKNILNQLAKEINYSFTDFLQQKKPYLSTKQINELQRQGFTFGAHSVAHPLYQNLSLTEQIHQTTESLQFLKHTFNVKESVFAFPFYDNGISTNFFNKIKNSVSLTFGTLGLKNDTIPFHIQRLDMEKNKSNIKAFLIKKYLKYLLQKKVNKHMIKRK